MRGGEGLSAIPLRELRTMLARVHRGELVCPITQQQLVVAGLPNLVDRVGFLSGLDATAVRAVLVAVIAERMAAEARAAKKAAP